MHVLHNSQILWGPSLASTALSEGMVKAELAPSLFMAKLAGRSKCVESFLEMLFSSISLQYVHKGQYKGGWGNTGEALHLCSGPPN